MLTRVIVTLMFGWLIFGSAGDGSFIVPTSAHAEEGGDLTPPEPEGMNLLPEAMVP